MTPIDRELERALSAHAAGLVPSGDLLDDVERQARNIRRRRGVMTGAAALAALAVAVAVPLATRDSDVDDPGQGFATQQPSVAASPSPEPSEAAYGTLNWEQRGESSGIDELANHIEETLTKEFGEPPHFGFTFLWTGNLSDGRLIAVFESASAPAYAWFYVEDGDGLNGRIVQKLEVVDRNPQGPDGGSVSETRLAQVSAYVDGPKDFVVVVGAPGTSRLEFSADGRSYSGMKTVDGVGVVDVTKGGDRTAYRIRVYDANAVVVYDGPIDLLSED